MFLLDFLEPLQFVGHAKLCGFGHLIFFDVVGVV